MLGGCGIVLAFVLAGVLATRKSWVAKTIGFILFSWAVISICVLIVYFML